MKESETHVQRSDLSLHLIYPPPPPESLVKRMGAKRPRNLKNQKSERSLARSRAGRTSSAVRGEAGVGCTAGGAAGAAAPCALCFREELPTIYKCPYQGCTAVYRGADGMKVRKVLLKPGQESAGAGGGVRPRLTHGCP